MLLYYSMCIRLKRNIASVIFKIVTLSKVVEKLHTVAFKLASTWGNNFSSKKCDANKKVWTKVVREICWEILIKTLSTALKIKNPNFKCRAFDIKYFGWVKNMKGTQMWQNVSCLAEHWFTDFWTRFIHNEMSVWLSFNRNIHFCILYALTIVFVRNVHVPLYLYYCFISHFIIFWIFLSELRFQRSDACGVAY